MYDAIAFIWRCELASNPREQIELIGGSLAQLDLIDFTLLHAYVEAGRQEELRADFLT